MTDYPDFTGKGTKNCEGRDTEIFFPDEDAPDYRRNAYVAKTVCTAGSPEGKECAYMEDCLIWALGNENFGVWGGTTPEERKSLKRAATRLKYRSSIYR
ncbi:MAG: WhiB family transcriptional regulator [Cetobacterium sp.]